MTDAQRARNCEKCNTRKIQDKYLGRVFDYRNCPFVCLKNKVDNANTGIIGKKSKFIFN